MQLQGQLCSQRFARHQRAHCSALRRQLRRDLVVQASSSDSNGAGTSGTSTAQLVSNAGLIFANGASGSWDDGGVGFPVVRCYVGDDENRWFMWYSGRDGKAPAIDVVAASSGSIGVAVSKDGITWTRGTSVVEGERGPEAEVDVGKMMEPNKDWWTFDTCHMGVADVQVLSNSSVSSGVGVYWMFYSGGDYEPCPLPQGLPGLSMDEGGEVPATLEGLRMRPGLAMSQDGRNWARIEADHHTGALFDVGGPGEWDELFIGTPQVLAVGPKDMRMYYHSWSQAQKRFIIGLAASPDGFRWNKKGIVFDPATAGGQHDALGAASACVVRDFENKQYLMFYEAVAKDGSRSIGLAVSKDGLKDWKRSPQPVLVPAAAAGSATQEGGAGGAWDAGSVGAPCAVSMSGGKWRLYYCGRQGVAAGPWQGIGLARSVDGPMFEGVPISFKRIESP